MSTLGEIGPFVTEAEAIRATGQAEWPPDSMKALNEIALFDACRMVGVDLGEYDVTVLRWLAGWEPQIVAAVIGIVLRAATS